MSAKCKKNQKLCIFTFSIQICARYSNSLWIRSMDNSLNLKIKEIMKKNLPIYAYNSVTVQLLVSCEGKFCSRIFAFCIKFWIVEAHQMLIWYSLVNKTREMMTLFNCVRGQRHELWPLITGEKSAGAKFQIFCNMFQLPSLIKIWTLIHNILFFFSTGFQSSI